jgi:tetratricopeptide (TPR) repeat protein
MKKIANILPYLVVFGLLIFSQATVYGQTEDESLDEIVALGNAGKYKKALKLCDQLIAKNPKCVDAYLHKTDIYFALKDPIKMFQTLNNGLSENPNSSLLYNQRGGLYQTIGKIDLALRDINLGLKFADNDSVKTILKLSLSSVKFEMMDFQGSYDLLKECYLRDSNNLDILNDLAIASGELKKNDETVYYLTRIIQADSLFSVAYMNMGFYYQKNGEYKKSLEYLDKAIELDPKDSYGYNNRSYSKLKTGDLEGALKDVNQSIDLFAYNSYAYRNRALIYLEMGQKSKACEDLQRAVDLGFTSQYGNEVRDLIGRNC